MLVYRVKSINREYELVKAKVILPEDKFLALTKHTIRSSVFIFK